MIFVYEVDGRQRTVTLERRPDGSLAAAVDGQPLAMTAAALPDGGWRLTVDGRRMTAYAAAHGSARYVNLDGQEYWLTVPEARATRRRAAGGGDLTAQMPGQVIEVLVAVGDAVTRGQTLVILEAMKMEIRAAAPADGVVKRLLVRPGEVVERGQLLAEIE